MTAGSPAFGAGIRPLRPVDTRISGDLNLKRLGRSIKLLKLTRKSLVSVTFAAALLIAWVPIGAAAELVMFESDLCEWCETWHGEIGVVYPKTEEGRAASPGRCP